MSIWSSLYCLVEETAKALVNWALSKKHVFTNKDERTIGQGIVAKCQLEGLNPFDDNDRQKAAKGIADIADSVVGEIAQYKWNIALRRLYQLTSEMRMSVGDNGNTISFIIGGSKSKQGLG